MTAQPSLEEALASLTAHAEAADAEPVWPAASWEALRRSGVLGWVVPREYGGTELPALDLLDGYGRLAGACLTTCFLLSQRDAACRRLRNSGNVELCRALLPSLTRGDTFATVGLSQLTTSRQHVRPVLMARLQGSTVVLDGVMPWVTGAAQADYFVTGAVVEEGGQVLLVVPNRTPGVRVGDALPLMALQGSLTAEVACTNVELEPKWILAGPAERVMPPGRGPGGLETSCLALGLATAAIAYLQTEGQKRPEWQDSASACAESAATLHGQMMRLASAGGTAEEAAQLRAQANALVMRATQLALAAGKGSAFLRSPPGPALGPASAVLPGLVVSASGPRRDVTVSVAAVPE